ncbi:MAG TPA: carboxypeptidase-like regulatory domain-containing protein [Polyangiaceae bacterium]|nr:carboxypeptidase-like regulatory domain-containing protein [Polyangiaceae bacterium]
MPLRITGSVTLDASASLHDGSSEVEARLLDDAGHPVPGAEVEIKPSTASSQAWTARECHTHTPPVSPNADGAYTAHSDGSGALCAHFDGVGEHAEFELSFSDPNGLYASATRHVIADSATRSVEMAFAPAPTVLALERDEQIFSLVTRAEPALAPGDALERLPVTLRAKTEAGTSRELARANVELGGGSEFRVPSRALGAPGPLELRADFSGSASTREAHAIAHVTCTALARLSLAEPLTHRSDASVHLRVRVDSVAGRVPSGSIEAESGGVSLGSARVSAGNAELDLQLDEAATRARAFELRYVADSPWWLPGEPLEVRVPIVPPSPWHRIAWLLAAMALCGWLFVNWQRPRRIERSLPNAARPALRAPVDVIEVGDAARGWHGRVLDAHDGSPIAGAAISVRLPAFDGQGVLRSAQSGADGSFAIEGAVGPGAALEVRAPWHVALAAPMPPPGQIVLSLVSRRRSLLARFATWTRGDAEWGQQREPTPGEVARKAARSEVAAWAGAVNEAAFGPDPLSEAKEQAVVGREPAHGSKP